MKPVLRDPRSGARYPMELLDEWGVNGVGDGYGPVPIAIHLVENPRTGALEVAGRKGGFTTPLAVEMVADNTPDPDLGPLRFSRDFVLKGQRVSAAPAAAAAAGGEA